MNHTEIGIDFSPLKCRPGVLEDAEAHTKSKSNTNTALRKKRAREAQIANRILKR